MNAFALLSLLSAIMSSFLGIFVYSKDTKNSMNRLFMLSCLSLSYWAFTEFGLRQAESFDSASFWIKLNFLWPFTLAFLLHFTLVFTEQTKFLKTKATYALIYAPTSLFSFLAMNIAPGTPIRTYWGWTYTFFENILVFYISATWAVALGTLALYLLLRYYIRADKRKKQQTKYILIGFSFPVIMGSLTEGLFPLLSIRFPELTNSSFVLGSIVIAYAVLKYELFVLTPATATENIIATISDALFLVNPDRKIVSVNQTTLELLGYEEKELIGQSMKSILTEDSEKSLFKRIESNELIGERSICDIETVFKTKDARSVPISLSVSIMHDNNGELKGIIFIGRDITERKQTEDRIRVYTENLEKLVKESLLELKESEARYQELYESSIDGIALTNRDAKIVDCNQAFADILGYKKDELYQRTLYNITPRKWHELNKKIFAEQVFVRGYSDEYEKEYIKKDGAIIPVSAKAWTIKDKNGNIVGSWGIVRDITERKKLDQMKTNFINVAAHELRTPLSALKAHVDLLKIKSEQGYWELPQEVHEKI
ncbi:MAG: PAS domain S-box protein, partial [Promethearchaeota archaeon]